VIANPTPAKRHTFFGLTFIKGEVLVAKGIGFFPNSSPEIRQMILVMGCGLLNYACVRCNCHGPERKENPSFLQSARMLCGAPAQDLLRLGVGGKIDG